MRTKWLISAGLALVGTIALVECSDARSSSTAPERTSGAVRATPAPMFTGRPIDNIATREVVAHARTLHFDATTPGGDRVMIRTPGGANVQLQIDPEVGAASLTNAQIEAGRVIGRVYSTAAYAPLGIAAGTNYFWVDGTGDRARAIVIPEDEHATRTVRPLLLRNHATKIDFATARFLNVASGDGPIPLINLRCGSWCCSFTSAYEASAQPLVDAALIEMHQRVDGLTR